MHQKKSFIHQANASKNAGVHHHAAAVDDVDFGDCRRLGGVDGYLFSLEKTGLIGAVEHEAVGANLVRFVHECNDRTKNAKLRSLPSSPQQGIQQVGGDGGVVVQKN